MDEVFKTDNMAIAAYLDVKGIKYLGPEVGVGRTNKPITFFKFDDSEKKCQFLEREYRNSAEKNYRDSLMFFRNEVHKIVDSHNEGDRHVTK